MKPLPKVILKRSPVVQKEKNKYWRYHKNQYQDKIVQFSQSLSPEQLGQRVDDLIAAYSTTTAYSTG